VSSLICHIKEDFVFNVGHLNKDREVHIGAKPGLNEVEKEVKNA
jgi:hypothetical protein